MNEFVLYIAGGFLSFGILAAIIRMIKGPSVLDRVTASDAILGAILCVLGLEMVINKHTYTLPVVLAISVFAMLGTVSIASFIHKSPNDKADDEAKRADNAQTGLGDKNFLGEIDDEVQQ